MNKCRLTYSLLDTISNISDLNSSFSIGTLKVAYAGTNANRTSISKEVFEANVSSMYNCPIVANYNVETAEIGGHDVAIIETDDGERMINITEPVGVVPESATYRWETLEDNGVSHDYFCVDGVILWKRQPCYSKLAANGITSQSIEIDVTGGKMENGIFHIEEFQFEAFCLLERDEPCFEQASLQVYAKDEFKQQWTEMIREYSEMLGLEKNKDTGGITVKDFTVIDNPKNASPEVVAEIAEPVSDPVENPEVVESEVEDIVESVEESEAVEVSVEQNYSHTAKQLRVALELSLHEIFGECCDCYIEDWDENEVYVYDWKTGQFFGYEYTVSGDIVTIQADTKKKKKIVYVDVESESESNSTLTDIITAIVDSSNASLSDNFNSQIDDLNNTIADLNGQVSELTAFKLERLAAERSAAENKLFSQFDAQLKTVPEYQDLKEKASDYSLVELETQCYALIGRKNYSFSKTEPPKRIPVDCVIEQEIEAYGGLLKNKTRI